MRFNFPFNVIGKSINHANHGAYSNPSTQVGIHNKDFGAVPQSGVTKKFVPSVAQADIDAQGPEEMCLSLEHQNPAKTSEKWVFLIALQFRYTFYKPQTKRLRSRKIGLQYKIRKGRKQIWGRFLNP